MDGLAVLDWCRSRPGVTEEFPFGPDVRVLKVWGRMFAVCSATLNPGHVSIKCDPRFAEYLRAEYTAITAAYHMNKRHWNTVQLNGGVPDRLVGELLGHSYTLVVDGLPKRYRMLAEGRAQLDEAAYRSSDFGPADSLLQEARRLAEVAGDRRCIAAVLDQLGTVRHWRNLEAWSGEGFPHAAPRAVSEELNLLEEALAIRRTLGHEAETGESAFRVGLVHQMHTGDWGQAEACFNEARRLAETTGNRWLLFETHRHLGAVAWHGGDFERAVAHFTTSLQHGRRIGRDDSVAMALVALGRCKLAAGRISAGTEHLCQGVELGESLGLRARILDPARRALARARATQQEGGG